MICVRAFLSPILSAGCHSIWTSTPVCLVLLAFPPRCHSRLPYVISVDTSKISKRGCKMVTAPGSRHIVVLRHGQFCKLYHSTATGVTMYLPPPEIGST